MVVGVDVLNGKIDPTLIRDIGPVYLRITDRYSTDGKVTGTVSATQLVAKMFADAGALVVAETGPQQYGSSCGPQAAIAAAKGAAAGFPGAMTVDTTQYADNMGWFKECHQLTRETFPYSADATKKVAAASLQNELQAANDHADLDPNTVRSMCSATPWVDIVAIDQCITLMTKMMLKAKATPGVARSMHFMSSDDNVNGKGFHWTHFYLRIGAKDTPPHELTDAVKADMETHGNMAVVTPETFSARAAKSRRRSKRDLKKREPPAAGQKSPTRQAAKRCKQVSVEGDETANDGSAVPSGAAAAAAGTAEEGKDTSRRTRASASAASSRRRASRRRLGVGPNAPSSGSGALCAR